MYITKVDTNKYRATLSQTINGKRKRYTKTFTTAKKKDAVRMAQVWEQEVLTKGSSDYTVYGFISAVWETVIKNKSPNTVDGYNTCRGRIIDTLDDMPASDLSPRILQKWIDKLTKANYSAKTIRSTYSVLSRCCSIAVAWEMLNANPCHDVILPTNTNKSTRILSPSELATFISSLDTLPLDSKVLFELALFCSLRRGEVLAIEDKPIGDRILIDKARYRSKNGIDFTKEPKTSSGKRYCAVPEFVQKDIADLRVFHASEKKRLGSAWNDSKYLIKAEDGTPLRPQAVNERLRRYVCRIGIDHITYHQLRHTYASIVASEGTDLVTLSRLMGHSNKSTTLNIYTHLFKDERDIGKAVANSFDNMVESLIKSHEKVTNSHMKLRCNYTIFDLLYQRKNFFKII